MLDRAKCLSSSPDLFSKECYDLRKMFLKLKYPVKLIDSIFKRFHASQDQSQSCIKKSADSVRRQLSDLGKKIDRVLQPVFPSGEISEDLKVKETKPSLVRGSPIPLSKTVSRISIWPFHASRKNQKTASRSQKKASNHVSRKNAYSIHVLQNIQIQSLQEFYETFN